MNKIIEQSFSKLGEWVKAIPLILLKSETQFLLGGRATQSLFGNMKIDPYSEHSWVYAAVNSIALNIASVPFVFQNNTGPVRDTQWQNLFEEPNEDQSFGEFMEAIITWLHIRGEAFVILDRESQFDMPKAMLPVDPSMVREVLNKNQTKLLGWLIPGQNGEDDIKLQRWEVVHFKLFNPMNRWRGLSPLSAAASGLNLDILTNKFNTMFYQNGGKIGGVVELQGNLGEKQFERFREQWRDQHGGVQNAHKVAILEGGAQFKQVQISQKDMDFLNQKKWNRDEILAVFKVPKMEVGVWDDINFAVAKVQAREFWLKNLIPKTDLISWTFWHQLFKDVRGGRTWAEFDTSDVPALQDEFADKVDTGFKLWQMGWTANQINNRLRLGMEINEWQHAGYIPVNVQPVGEDGMPRVVEPDTSDPASDEHEPSQTGEEPGSKSQNVIEDEVFIEMKTKLKKYFYSQRTKQLKAINHGRVLNLRKQEENEKLASLIGIEVNTVKQVNAAIQETLLNHLGPNASQGQAKEVIRNVYNRIERRLPDIISHLREEQEVL